MEGPDDWLVMLRQDGTVEAVDGGAPVGWTARRIDDCVGMPEAVKSVARKLLRDPTGRSARTPVRRERIASQAPGSPSFTVLTVEAIPLLRAEILLAPLLQRALGPLAKQAAGESILFEIDVAEAPNAVLSIDAEKIAWAVAAIAGNALRYVRRGDETLPGGRVRVHAATHASQRMAEITVKDDGPGIPADLRPWLLEPDPKTGHTAGVGLRLVHDIVTAHGGGVVIKSSTEPRERGTSVTLWLPLAD